VSYDLTDDMVEAFSREHWNANPTAARMVSWFGEGRSIGAGSDKVKPDIELKKVKDGAYVIVIRPGNSATAVYVEDETGMHLMRPKKRVDKAKVMQDTMPVSQRGEAASRRAAFTVHQGGRSESGLKETSLV